MKIGLIYGGVSVEHEISIITALQIRPVLEKKHEVTNIYFSKNGKFYVGDILNDISNYKNLDNVISNATEVYFIKEGNEVFVQPKKRFAKKIKIDLGFLALHGASGEDGRIQGYFDILGLTYTGPSHYGSSFGQDKIITKSILRDNKINVLDFRVIYDNMSTDEIIKIVNELTFPVILKPSVLGSSVGITVCKNIEDLEVGISEVFKYDTKVIVEHCIDDFKEVNCSILGDYTNMQASFIEEVLHETEFLSFDEKYISKGSSKGMASASRIVPAPISETLEKQVKEVCLRAFKALNLSGVVRFDLMIKDNEVYINEVNTLPGSLAFYLWEPAGISREMLYEELIKLAVAKKRIFEAKISSYETNVLEKGSFSNKGAKKF